jgi:hypothetical protein
MTRAETRWWAALYETVLGTVAPDDLRDAAARYLRCIPPARALGVRALVALANWLAVLWLGRPLHRAPPAARARYLTGLDHSAVFLLRQIVPMLKAVFLLFHCRDARALRAMGMGSGAP